MSAIQEWNKEVARLMEDGHTKAEAVEKIVNDNESLHQRYLAEWNAKHGNASERMLRSGR